MLKKSFRLRSRYWFKRTLKGRRLCSNSTAAVFVFYKPDLRSNPTLSTTPQPTRFGFVVSKKVHPRAVRRNKIKRRLREIARHILTQVPQLPYANVVIIARPGALETDYKSLCQMLTRAILPQAPEKEKKPSQGRVPPL